MRVLVIDPGKVTGWFHVNLRYPGDWMGGELPHDDFLDWVSPSDEDVSPLTDWALDRVIVEHFDITATTGQAVSGRDPLWAVEQVGCLRFWCRKAGVAFEEQSRTAKRFDSDGAKLKAIGWWKPADGVKGEAGHRRDACRHALKWGVDHGLIDPKGLL